MIRVFSQYVSRKSLLLLLADAVVVSLSALAGVWLRYLSDPVGQAYLWYLPDLIYRIAALVVCFQICAFYAELYDARADHRGPENFFRVAQSLGVACFILASAYYIFPVLRLGRGPFAIAVVFALLLMVLVRSLADRFWQSATPRQNVLILSRGPLAETVAREIQTRQDLNMRIVGFVAVENEALADIGPLASERTIGEAADLEELVRTYSAGKVLLALEDSASLPAIPLLRLRTRGVQVEDAREMLAGLTGKISIDTVASSWFILTPGFRRSQYSLAFKRLLDLALSLTGLILCLPVMLVVAILVKLDSPGPALFRQRRVGQDGQCFELMKFRTMSEDAEADGVARWASEDDPRITRLGGFFRKYRLDELPQFLNVIRGQMSFVGPRPERPEFVQTLRQDIPFYDERHTMRPGITGWAQICYPYGATVEDALRKLEYDLFYLKNVSVLFDLAIVFQTVRIILWGRGR